jgi:hypothetical protein
MTRPITVVHVKEVSEVGDRLLAVVEVVSGEASTGMKLVNEGTGEAWEVRGVSFTSPEAWRGGIRGLALKPVGHSGKLEGGARLSSAAVHLVPC